MNRFDYMFARRYSMSNSLNKYDEEITKMSAKDRRKDAELKSWVQFAFVIAIIYAIGLVGTYLDTGSRIAHHQTIDIEGK